MSAIRGFWRGVFYGILKGDTASSDYGVRGQFHVEPAADELRNSVRPWHQHQVFHACILSS